ncbi:hypothetical protein [Streptomyces sp. NPDC002156]
MTTTHALQPLTVRAFLLDSEERQDSADALVDPVRSHGLARTLLSGVPSLTPAADQAVERELATVIDSFLGLDLLDLASGGWRKHAELTAAARRTRAVPGSEEVVALATHSITSSHRPFVDVFVDGTRIGTLEVELTLLYQVAGLVAVVRDACLARVRSGECTIDGTLTVQRIVLAERQGRLDLPGTMRLREPIPLLRNEPPPPPPPPPSPPSPPRPTPR